MVMNILKSTYLGQPIIEDSALILMGQLRVGDSFHVIPTLNELRTRFKSFVWIASIYHREAVRLIAKYSTDFRIFPVVVKLKELPIDYESIKRFQSYFDCDGLYDTVITDFTHPTKENTLWRVQKPEPLIENALVVHSATISFWKSNAVFRDLDLRGTGSYLVGHKEDSGYFPEVDFDLRGQANLEMIFKLVCHARAVIAIHSAVACMAFYLRRPLLVLHHAPDLFEFSKLSHSAYDLPAYQMSKLDLKIEISKWAKL